MNNLKKCRYCNKTFIIKSNRGSSQKYCSMECKNDLHALGRQYLKYQLETGKTDIHSVQQQVTQHLKHKALKN